jgi:hypothetical protein
MICCNMETLLAAPSPSAHATARTDHSNFSLFRSFSLSPSLFLICFALRKLRIMDKMPQLQLDNETITYKPRRQ